MFCKLLQALTLDHLQGTCQACPAACRQTSPVSSSIQGRGDTRLQGILLETAYQALFWSNPPLKVFYLYVKSHHDLFTFHPSFLVQFLLTGPCGQCNPVDGAEEQFSLTQETQSLLLNIDWRVGTASGRDDLSRCTCYTELKLSLQKAALPKVLLNGMR